MDSPPTPFLLKMGVVGVGSWVDMGVGVCGVCGPMDGPPYHFPVWKPVQLEVECPPPRVHATARRFWVSVFCGLKFSRDPPYGG